MINPTVLPQFKQKPLKYHKKVNKSDHAVFFFFFCKGLTKTQKYTKFWKLSRAVWEMAVVNNDFLFTLTHKTFPKLGYCDTLYIWLLDFKIICLKSHFKQVFAPNLLALHIPEIQNFNHWIVNQSPRSNS